MIINPTSPALRPWQRRLKTTLCGFLYWFLFLIVLEPGNVYRALQSGYAPGFGHEVLRIVVASLLGTFITPVLLALTRRFPIIGPQRWRHAAIHVAATVFLSLALILISCFLAAWIFMGTWLPASGDIHEQLVGNGLLLMYAIFGFTALIHLFNRMRVAAPADSRIQFLERVPVKTRTGQIVVDLASVEWIETQGNYLALHAGPDTHLIRETLVRLEAQLDPARFVRVHRRIIVAVAQIKEMQTLPNGDTSLRLCNGQELRASRNYRESIRDRWLQKNEPASQIATDLQAD
jgi:two-component system LytT family response regulator